MTRRFKAGKRALGALGLVTSATMLSGCFYLNPAQTNVSYNGGDGANAVIGSLKMSSVTISTRSKGAPGAMHGLVANSGGAPVVLTIAIGGSSAKVTIPADTAIRLDGKTSGNTEKTVAPILVANTPVIPGKKADVVFSTPGTGQTPVQVPVLESQDKDQ
ncbi:hypothetical protein V3G39_04820 [Dermatophilaceae bacterium Sec6.4]